MTEPTASGPDAVTATAPATSHGGRLSQLDGLRGLAALVIMLYHTALVFRTHGPFVRGYLLVDLFFLLSGFVLAVSTEKKLNAGVGALEFTGKRFVRLWPLVAVGAAWLVCLACYLLLPVRPPHWRAALVPAIVAGTAIGLLTSLFGVLAPMLAGGFTSLGVIASVFIALVWLNWLFQALLLGAAYARHRDVQQRHRESEVARIF